MTKSTLREGTKIKNLSTISRWLLFIAYMLVLSWLSLTPAPPEIAGDFFGWDKVQHAGAYGIFALLAGWTFGTFPLSRKRRWWLAVIAAVTFGGLLEIAQGVFTTQRSAEWSDLLADLIGAICIYGLIMISDRWLSLFKKRSGQPPI